jgi:hypothetical protein
LKIRSPYRQIGLIRREKEAKKERGKKRRKPIMGSSTTQKITGKQDVTNSQLMLPEHVQDGGIMKIHETVFILLVY